MYLEAGTSGIVQSGNDYTDHVRRVVRREKQERKERGKPGTEVRKPKGE